MKTIFACDIDTTPFKMVIDNNVTMTINKTYGNIDLLFHSTNLKTKQSVLSKVVVGDVCALYLCSGGEWERIVDDILPLPCVHCTPPFCFNLIDYIFSLSIDDIELITTWKELRKRYLENS